MFKRVAGTAIAVAALSLFPALPVFAADPMPGDPCTQEGLTRPLGNGLIACQGGTWQPSTGGAPGGNSPGSPPSSSASSAKTLGNFKTVGTALSQATFGSTGRQVADATAWRMPDGRVRLFAFVNEGPMPGLRIATSTSRTGTTFAGESTNPFPDIAVGQPRAWALGGNSLRLFYVQAGNIDTAVSNDGGLTWTKEGSVLTTAQAGFEPGVISIIKQNGTYRAYFSNLEKPGEHAARVMKTATSTDLVNWTVGPTVVSGGGSHPFAVIDKKGKIALYYAADRGATYGIFESTSTDGIKFGNEKLVVQGAGDPDILANGKTYLMYYGADLGADGFGVKVAKSVGKVVP